MAAPSAAERVATLAAEIRTLKAQLTKEGLKSDAINRHPDVVAKVAALKDLKATLDSDDPARDEVFFARQQADREEAVRQEQALAKRQREELDAAEAQLRRPLVQRKIFHLFQFAGSGPSFHYEPPPRLNAAQCGFGEGSDPHPAVYVTEKWDGTTMQATSRAIFKRLDVRGKKSKLGPSGRYDLRLVAWRSEGSGNWKGLDFVDADRRVTEAITPYLPRLEALAADLCIYFEVVHTDINTTFKNLPGFADIRAFDFSRSTLEPGAAEGQFLPFEESIALAEEFEFPIVGWQRSSRLDAAEVWAELRAAAQRNYKDVPAPLEGFVVREAGKGERIAKARVEHLHAAASHGDGAAPVVQLEAQAARPGANHGYGYWSLAHLAELGLRPGVAAYTLRHASDAFC